MQRIFSYQGVPLPGTLLSFVELFGIVFVFFQLIPFVDVWVENSGLRRLLRAID